MNHISDMIKINRALENGVSIIRLYRPEVYLVSWDCNKFVKTLLKERQNPVIEFVTDTEVYSSWKI
jgi:hypothetical protein